MNVTRAVHASAVFWLVAQLVGNPTAAQMAGRALPQKVQQTARRTSVIAVVDLVKVFDQHPYFKANLAATQQQAHEFELLLAARKRSISARGRHLNELSTDSAEYRKLEAELAREISNLRLWTRQHQQQLTRQKAQHYYTAYQEIVGAIARVAQQQQIALVLRVSTGGQPPGDVQSMVRWINRPIVVQRNLDITQQVINELRTATAQRKPRSTSPRPSR